MHFFNQKDILITQDFHKCAWYERAYTNFHQIMKKKINTALKCCKSRLSYHSVYKNDSRVDTAKKMKFSIKDFVSKCDQIRSFLRIWSHLLKKFLMKNCFFVQCETAWHGTNNESCFKAENLPLLLRMFLL